MDTRKIGGSRPGFTFVETLYVLVIAGLLLMVTYPKAQTLAASSSLSSANRYVRTYLNTARATAIQRGRPTQIVIRGDTLSVRADTLGNGTFVTLLGPVSLTGTFNVTVNTTQDSIVYTPRGFATNLPATGVKILLARPERRDSVCVSTIGTVLAGC